MVQPEIMVLDDFFPNLLTGFRVAEYNALLAASPSLLVLSANPDFEVNHAAYAGLYPRYAARVRPFEPSALLGCKLAYVNFLNNAVMFLPHLQEREIPFILTLYPGGGLGLQDAESDAKLLQVLGNPLLKGLIVTVPVTRDYVLDFMRRHGLPAKPIHLVRGVVVHPDYFELRERVAPASRKGGDPLRVCFVAEKYMPAGRNKGYPDFIEAAKALLASPMSHGTSLEFHIVGGFGPEDWDVSALDGHLHFHGRLETGELKRFFTGMDLLVSPNLPGALHVGNFDGFPTGSAVEASLCGVALMVTDPLQQNPGYVAGESYWPIPVADMSPAAPATLAPAIVAAIEGVLQLPQPRQHIQRVGRAGREVSRTLYAPDYQMGLRMGVLRAHASAAGSSFSH